MSTHETDLPTQQTPPKKNDRLPRPNENPGRTQNHQPPAKGGAQNTGRLTKAMRLRSRPEFRRVVREGYRLVGRLLCIDCRPAVTPRLGISASGRFGSAVERNRFKRLVREAFRVSYRSLPAVELNVIPRQGAKRALCPEVLAELTRLLTCS